MKRKEIKTIIKMFIGMVKLCIKKVRGNVDNFKNIENKISVNINHGVIF